MARIKGKRRAHDDKKLDSHITGESSFVEMGAKNAPVENIAWKANQVETHSDPIEEGGHGGRIVVRTYQFQLPPTIEEVIPQELLDFHMKHTVTPILWRDELTVIKEPRIVMDTKGSFRIVVACGPRLLVGNMLSTIEERPELIQHIINGSGQNPN